MTPEQVRDDVLGTLEVWLPGYTNPIGNDEPQNKISLTDETGNGDLYAQYEIPYRSGNFELFKINVSVEKVI